MTLSTVGGVALLVAVGVLLAGAFARLFVFERDADDVRPSTGPRADASSDVGGAPREEGAGRAQPAG
jgi:hypothetical protein